MKKFFIVLLLILLLACPAFADDLADIRDSGVLRFGVSPDHFPFVFYDKNDDLTGIDIKLMEEIAALMDVELDIYEMSADSLVDSLLIGQVDVIGGAFSKTEARKEKIDFTKIYYSTGAVFVSRSGTKLTEPLQAESFTGYRIGVQKETGFEEWLTTDFLEKETVTRKDIYSYASVDDAMKALNKGKIDMVMMDANVYLSSYEDDSDYLSWQYGSAEDSFAFGVRKSTVTKAEQRARKTTDLKTEIDRHLSALLTDGTAQEIANKFFNNEYEEEQTVIQWSGKKPTPAAVIVPVSTAIPSPTPMPTATTVVLPTIAPIIPATSVPTAVPVIPTATVGQCSYSYSYVSDVTIPDGQQIDPGSYFTKTWRIKNTGTCTWTPDFTLSFSSGTQMGGVNTKMPKYVYPGETVDISITMIAPVYSGIYQGNWQLKTPLGYSIGTPIWVKITVPGSNYPTATPEVYYYSSEVQQPVKPEILWYYPNFYSQNSGECVNVYWGLARFSTAEITVDGTSVYFGGDEAHFIQICDEVQAVGQHYIKLCAYAVGGTTCETLLYTTK